MIDRTAVPEAVAADLAWLAQLDILSPDARIDLEGLIGPYDEEYGLTDDGRCISSLLAPLASWGT